MNLPRGWAQATILQIAETKLGKMLDAAKNKGEPVAYLRNINVRWGEFDLSDLLEMRATSTELSELAVRNGDIFVCEGGEPGRCAVWHEGQRKLIFQKALHRVRVRNDIQPEYVARYIRHFASKHEFSDFLTGTTIKHLPQVALQKIAIELPPLAEQRRIVAKLDALFARLARARAELDRVSVEALRIRRATLSEIFDSEENLTEFSEVLEDIQAGKNLKCIEQPPRSDEKGVVKVSAVSSERFLASESKTLPSSYRPPERDRILRGDLLIARASGSLDLVGRVALVESCSENLYLSDKILRLVLRADLKQWAYWFLRSPSGRRQIEDAASGISMHNITQASIQKLRFALPDEAKRRAALQRLNTTFARADRLEAEAARARALLDRLEAAILTKAFKGELVPQDPNDEPGSVLLERIRAQRVAAAPASKTKRGRRLSSVAG